MFYKTVLPDKQGACETEQGWRYIEIIAECGARQGSEALKIWLVGFSREPGIESLNNHFNQRVNLERLSPEIEIGLRRWSKSKQTKYQGSWQCPVRIRCW
jgi:hypothetical protein